ncbi:MULTISPECIES: nucleotidyltransferase-like protein [Pontibacillus]|uniref:Nucleotidyltransferase-like protein n=1 Tax=Pontibacillus chungwhensis TaxID=265426 RepID=A0ABY8V4C1_9BACI|nr:MULTISPECIES: nucleotidyltransferase-like protein [Pontibacillus]MCD5325574.1 nucleotidyltransferase-like protein [Pontibacillus sp. HN14]WIF98681.1 nucleotidyltransferase-like protein [Pontibacillus chungwhensis]
MEDVLRPIYQERASQKNTLGILIIEKKKPISPVTDNFDVILLIIVRGAAQPWFVKHYEFGSKNAAMHIVDEKQLTNWIDTSSFRRAVEWVIEGRVIFDRNEYITSLKENLRNFPQEKRDLKKAIEFAKLIRTYGECKDLYETEQYMDAFSKMIHSLHYLARLSVIEKGFHPEVTVWNQVKRIEPEVYKLHQELSKSNETLDKRVQLMLLATEFAINSRTVNCAKHLIDVMGSKEEPWAYGELMVHPDIQPYALDLGAFLDYLVDKEVIEAVQVETKGKGLFHRTYRLREND